MVVTPWGNSESLRDRRLRPGPGVPRDDVIENQRERLFAAMVASVAERGYAATTVSDLVELSGVSSRSFYDLFADKQACFVAALEAMLQAAVAYAAQSVDEKEPADVADWEEQARRGFDSFAEMIALQPAAARMALIEAHVAGPAALAPVEQAAAGFEWLTRQTLEQSPERAGMPPEMVKAYIGAQQEIARTRLRRRAEAELPKLTGELWELIRAFRPPPEPLKLIGRVPKAQPERLDAHDHSERALRAFAAVVAERGYADTTIDQVLKRAQMSATTFYAHFSGKDDAMLAAIDTACAQAVAAAMPAFSRQAEWPDGIRAAYGALLNFLASHPALANLIAVAAYTAGDAAIERREVGTRPLAALLENNTSAWANMPPVVYELINGGVFHLLHRTVKEGGPEALPRLAPIITYIALFPFIGAEEACEVANGSGIGRRSGKGSRRSAAAASILGEAGSREGEPAFVGPDRPDELLWGGAGAQRMSEEERENLAGSIWQGIERDVGRAREAGTFEGRFDRHLVRVPLRVDEEGWRELTTLHGSTLRTTIEIQARSARRLRDAGERGIEARTVQLVFEMPDDEPEGDGS